MSKPGCVRIGVISDTHIPDRAEGVPQKALEAFAGVDMILHAGDLVELKVLKSLQKVCPDVRAVYGNMDPGPVHDQLHGKEVFEAGGKRIGLTHGAGNPKNLIPYLQREFARDRVDVVVFGHSHNPTNETIDGVLFFNPGSATDTVFAPYPSVGLLKIQDGTVSGCIVKI